MVERHESYGTADADILMEGGSHEAESAVRYEVLIFDHDVLHPSSRDAPP